MIILLIVLSHRRTRWGSGGTCPKKFLIKTRKNANSSKLRKQPLAEEFSEMGVGVGCRLVGCCRARLLLSGTKVDFVGAKRGVFGYGMGWGVVSSVSCQASLHLSGMKRAQKDMLSSVIRIMRMK